MIQRILKTCIVALGLLVVPAIAHADIFMLVTGLPGDATAKGHEKWIRVSSLDWKTTANTSFLTGAGAAVGKPVPDALQLGLPSGTWSQHFLRLISQGKHLPSVIIDGVASDGRPLYRMTLAEFFVTQYRLSSLPATPLPQDEIKGVFKRVKIEYYAVGADGRVTTTFVEWDINAGTSTPPI